MKRIPKRFTENTPEVPHTYWTAAYLIYPRAWVGFECFSCMSDRCAQSTTRWPSRWIPECLDSEILMIPFCDSTLRCCASSKGGHTRMIAPGKVVPNAKRQAAGALTPDPGRTEPRLQDPCFPAENDIGCCKKLWCDNISRKALIKKIILSLKLEPIEILLFGIGKGGWEPDWGRDVIAGTCISQGAFTSIHPPFAFHPQSLPPFNSSPSLQIPPTALPWSSLAVGMDHATCTKEAYLYFHRVMCPFPVSYWYGQVFIFFPARRCAVIKAKISGSWVRVWLADIDFSIVRVFLFSVWKSEIGYSMGPQCYVHGMEDQVRFG